jgi:hypothetical protein
VDTSTNVHVVIHYTDTPCREFSKPEATVADAPPVLFASCAAPIDPVALTLGYLDEVKEKGFARTRFVATSCLTTLLTILSAVQRLEPIANTCVASMPELLLLGEKVFKDGFKTREGSESKAYTVCRFL